MKPNTAGLRATALVQGLVVIVACQPDEPHPDPPAVQDPDSIVVPTPAVMADTIEVEIIENARPPDGSRMGWRLGSSPFVSIGVREGADAEMFSGARDATVLHDGRIVVLDRGSSELRVFDRRGTHLATWGGEGEGPVSKPFRCGGWNGFPVS